MRVELKGCDILLEIAIARKAAQKLGIPNDQSKPLYGAGRNSHIGEARAYLEWTWEGLR